ncbi:hypothetical protein L1049_023943 [Liquidambar formosana]|uniref:Uncharacterized protein n=1 Tax=Liquidambar formosana TaxID=63359 RepID=A0AAP0RU74_LIQFO
MVRTPCCDKTGLKKGTWTPEEDRKLMAYVTKYGCWNWRQLPKYAGLSRCGKSCRLRWVNYLRPNIKRGNYSQEEEDTIIRLHESLGNKWSAIAAQLPGRTDNEIKNHWHTNLKKRLKENPAAYEAKVESDDVFECETNQEKELEPKNSIQGPLTHQILESSPMSPQQSSSEASSMSTDTPAITSTNMVTCDNGASMEKYEELSGNFWTEPFVADSAYNRIDFLAPLAEPGYLFPHSPVSSGEMLCPYSVYDENDGLNW